MKFDIFCEIQIAQPWPPDHEQMILLDTIEQARAADCAGFDAWWQVEHHGSPGFSYSAAPEVVLTAIAMATKRMHVGHAGVLVPFRINSPLRVAERGATLDILSNGRFELGLARSGGKEWETFGVNPETTRTELREAMQIIPKMWTEPKFAWKSAVFEMPEREVVPKPLRKPHPRLWQTAGSPDSFRGAGEMGVGVLGTTLLSPVAFMKSMLDEYDAGIAACKTPAGKFMNKQKGVFTFVHVAESREQAIESGAAWSALWYVHAAPITFNVPHSIWWDQIRAGQNPHLARELVSKRNLAVQEDSPRDLEDSPDEIPVIRLLKRMARGEEVSFEEAHEVAEKHDSVIIGDVEHCRLKMEQYRNIGCDRLLCLTQFGSVPHEAVMRSIRLTGEHLIPHFAKYKEMAAQ